MAFFRSPRLMALSVFLLAAASLAAALALQFSYGLEPCPLCIFQRVAFAVAGVLALAAALTRNRALFCALAFLSGVGEIAGLGVALRHLWVSAHPQEASCSPFTLAQMAERFPIGHWLPKVLAGEAECASAAHWTLLGLNLPQWAALVFALSALLLVRAVFARLRQPSVA
jgi:protein dithiol:quinone oxidoreductase